MPVEIKNLFSEFLNDFFKLLMLFLGNHPVIIDLTINVRDIFLQTNSIHFYFRNLRFNCLYINLDMIDISR